MTIQQMVFAKRLLELRPFGHAHSLCSPIGGIAKPSSATQPEPTSRPNARWPGRVLSKRNCAGPGGEAG